MKTRNPFTLKLLSLLVVFGFAINSCDDFNSNQEIDRPEWQLVWSDEFEGVAGTPPSSENWNFDIGTGENGWGNQELQYYTNRPENASLDGEGNLVITARREGFQGSPFTSARINTQDLFEQQFGRFEARLIAPSGPGIWPAFWMLGGTIGDSEVWPQAGEIDMMEMRGQEPSVVHGSLHGPGYSAGEAITNSFTLEGGRFDTDYHIYAVEWFPNRIDFYIDDFLFQRVTRDDVEETGTWVYDKPFFILLNVAVGGTFVGFPVDATPFPQTMTIDYVRVFTQQ